MASVPVKRCRDCGVIKPATLEFFYKQFRGKYGVRPECKVCHNIAKKARYDPAQTSKQCKAYRAANAEKVKEAKRVWRLANSDKEREQQRQYRKANPEKQRARVRNRRALKSQAEGSHTAQEFEALCTLHQGRCHWCGKKIKGTPHADHVVALNKGGRNDISNIVPSCAFCNVSKGTRSPIEFAGRLF